MAGLLAFLALYFALAAWFLYTPYRIAFEGAGSDLGAIAWIMAACSLFLGVFMVKAIFSVKNATPDDLVELDPAAQPKLFEFLHALADAARAPRPHKVYVSSRVNAAVFYDLSLFNLIFPSKKNLEIGLGLVNTLTLGEFKAVLAHEFGHFAQRSMAVGRWVYVAQQIATHLVTRRDALDDFLVKFGNIDIRVRLVTGAVQLVVWAIRSLVESLFNLVIMMQRALSREMEMQADLVAVSLTGSDALIHALHRLQGADDAWERALRFIHNEQHAGRATRDVFAVQTHMLSRMSSIMNDDAYANVPPLPESGADQHRIFKAELAQPPRMWLTHPLNHEREANAKRVYVPAAIDCSNAWSLFAEPAALRQLMTERLLGEGKAEAVELEQSLTTLGHQFKREQYSRRYCGIYFGRHLARHVASHAQLRDPAMKVSLDGLPSLYPATLAADIQALRALEAESGQLQAVIAGYMSAQGATMRVRGVDYRRKQLPAALARVNAELAEVRARLHAHDHLCRSWHQATAIGLGSGWQAYLDGLLALIHYAEHTAADLEDLRGLLNNVTGVVTATRVNADGISRIVMQANELHHALEQAYLRAPHITLDTALAERLKAANGWRGMLEDEFRLPLAQNDSISDWLNVVDGWVASVVDPLDSLRGAALEELLLAETMVVRHARSGDAPAPAPAPSTVPASYPVLLAGAERPRQTTLGWWARFQRADGWLPASARALVAGGIVAAVLGASSFSAGHGTSVFSSDPGLLIYNGLKVPVVVSVDGVEQAVAANATARMARLDVGAHKVTARTADGTPIETFDTEVSAGGQTVYNVGGAAAMVEWTALYGPGTEVAPRMLGAPRWFSSSADYVLVKEPDSISTRGGGTTRTVLSGAANENVNRHLAALPDDEERARVATVHARLDPTADVKYSDWLGYLAGRGLAGPVMQERLKAAPNDVPLRRMEYSLADPAAKARLCAEATKNARAAPDNPDLAYLALRCRPNGSAPAETFAAAKRWPENGWLRNASGFEHMLAGRWLDARADYEFVRANLPAHAGAATLTIARLRRMTEDNPNLLPLAGVSIELDYLLEIESQSAVQQSPRRAYRMLYNGKLSDAIAAAAPDKELHADVLRLAGASEGALPDEIAAALALPVDSGFTRGSMWAMLALHMREGKDYAALVEMAGTRSAYSASILEFLRQLAARKNPETAAKALATLDIEDRSYAYSAGLVLIGDKAPQAWRDTVQRVLYPSERPYFR